MAFLKARTIFTTTTITLFIHLWDHNLCGFQDCAFIHTNILRPGSGQEWSLDVTTSTFNITSYKVALPFVQSGIYSVVRSRKWLKDGHEPYDWLLDQVA